MREIYGNFTQKDIERFESRINRLPSGCWEWTGSRHHKGHGYFSIAHKVIYAHRFAYALYVGDIPDGLLVCHHCDNGWCVNPEHLFIGTAKDNTNDMMTKGRNRTDHNNLKGRGKEIRDMYATGNYSAIELARIFSVVPASIGSIVRGVTRKAEGGTISADNRNLLSEEIVRKIREIRQNDGKLLAQIAKELNVPYHSVRNVIAGDSYADVV